MIKKIVLMKELLEDGYTVEAASNKAETGLSTLRHVFNERSSKY